MSACWSRAVRIARLAPWNPNPLMRPIDRLLSSIQILTFTVCLLAVPIAGAVGTETYTGAAERIRQTTATEVLAPATVSTDPVLDAETHAAHAIVRWNWHGQEQSARCEVPRTAARGDRVTVRLDSTGHLTTGPADHRAAVASGINAAIYVLVIAWVGSIVTVRATRWLVFHRHSADCDREWYRMDCASG